MIETARLRLRRPAARDWEAARGFFTSARAEGIGGPLTLGRAWRAFAAELGHWDMLGYGMWAVTWRDEDRAVAMVGPWTPADWPEPEVGWMVWDPAAEGRGVAFEAARAALDDAFGRLGWATAVSYIAQGNERSARLAERLGARLDAGAPVPQPPASQTPQPPTLVYRHPRPAPTHEARA